MPKVRQVLVVDDNAMSRELAHDVLQDAGWDVVEAASVAEAVRQLESGSVALLVLDWHLNAATGLDVLQHLEGQTPRPRVLVVTADARSELRAAALAAGADAVLTKPYRTAALQEAAEAALANADRPGK
ncbi:MAG: response regulator [Thermaerobacter sp.]|nr:response regulator [Thermaerobacter sp.]